MRARSARARGASRVREKGNKTENRCAISGAQRQRRPLREVERQSPNEGARTACAEDKAPRLVAVEAAVPGGRHAAVYRAIVPAMAVAPHLVQGGEGGGAPE